jgi:hypothetical protein
MFNVRTSMKQEYDDNNYFDASYISEVLGEEVEWSSYQVELLEEAVGYIESLKPSNSLHYVTGKEKPHIEDIESLKRKDELQHYPEIIDICIKCLNQNLSLKDLLLAVKNRDIY